MIIEDLLYLSSPPTMPAPPEVDALLIKDSLRETALVDIKFNTITSSVWLLLDCRGALQLTVGNTAIIVVHGVTRLDWQADPKVGRKWRSIMEWEPVASKGRFSCRAGIEPNAELHVDGTGAEFYVGDVPGGDEPPPDFMDDSDEKVRLGMARWASQLELISASYT